MDNYYNHTLLGNNSGGSFGRAGRSDGGGSSSSLLTVVVAAGILISLSILGNLAIALVTSLRMGRLSRFSSVYILLRQLALADLGVSCFFMPVQIGWIRMKSRRGESSLIIDLGACQTFAFLSALSLYLSGFTIVAIAMDRLLTLVRPEPRGANATKSAKIFAWTAGILAAVVGAPEAMVNRVEVHPVKSWIKKCTPSGAFESAEAEVAYALCQLLAFPFLPFTLTLFCYLRIWQKLPTMATAGNVGQDRENGYVERAQLHVLRLSVAISLVFLTCWTPYNAVVLWSWSKPGSVDEMVLKAALMLACTSPCLNPMIHAHFYMRWQRRQEDSMEMTSV